MSTRLICVAALVCLPAFAGGPWNVVTHQIAGPPQRVRLAPIDGDALPDLVFTAGPLGFSQPNTVAVWRNRGLGRFERTWNDVVTTDFGDWGTPLEIGDFDENGLNDLVLANVNGTGGFTYRPGDGSGEFPDEFFGPSFGGYVDDVTIADYDLDGSLDVSTTTRDIGPYVDRFNGDGDGGFSTGLPFASIGPATGPMELDSGDVTGDGVPDDVVSSPAGLLFTSATGANDTLTTMPMSHAEVADFDDDGLADIAATAPLDHLLLIFRSLGGGDFEPAVSVPTGRRPGSLTSADFDLDGDLDLAVCNTNGRHVLLFENDGAGNFAVSARISVGSGPVDVTAADIDADGDVDMVVANGGDESLSVLFNPLL